MRKGGEMSDLSDASFEQAGIRALDYFAEGFN
jgi:hypothetical protein